MSKIRDLKTGNTVVLAWPLGMDQRLIYNLNQAVNASGKRYGWTLRCVGTPDGLSVTRLQ